MKRRNSLVLAVLLCCFAGPACADPIHEAAQAGDLAKVQEIIQKNPKAISVKENKEFSGQTPLHFAARYGQKEVVEFLIGKGADVNAKDDDGWTPLHLACYGGFIKSVTILLQKGAKIDAECVSGAPLHVAAGNGHEEVCQFLVEKGAKVNQKAGQRSWTPLHSAAYGGHMNTAVFLISKDADIREVDSEGKTPRNIAESQGNYDVVTVIGKKEAALSAGGE